MNEKNNSRRDFLKKASLGGALTLSIPQIVSAAYAEEKPNKISLSKNNVILFQGDSITDSGRNRESTGYNNDNAVGYGYTLLATANLICNHANKDLKIYNKGISGNKVYQLAERWEKDCLSLKPDVLSILIGVNDFWHKLKDSYKGTVETYRNDFKSLLERTKQQLPQVKLIIGEPFAVIGIKAVDESWYPGFNEYRKAAREIADQFGAVFIPYQTIFDKAQKMAPGSYWTYDGVHPSLAGSQLMAQAWLQAIK